MAGDDPQQQGQWIRIADFTPGIHEDYFAASGGGSTLVRNGAATRTNTYRVHADPLSGALTPLPRAVAGTTDTPAGTLAAGHYPAANIAWYVMDAQVQGNNGATSAAYPTVADTRDDSVSVMYQFIYDNNGGGNSYRFYAVGRNYRLVDATKQDFTFSKGNADITPPRAFRPAMLERAFEDTSYPGYGYGLVGPTLGLAYLGMGFYTGVAYAASGAIPAADQALSSYYSLSFPDFPTFGGQGYTNGIAYAGNSDRGQLNTFRGTLVLMHQGRLVYIENYNTTPWAGQNRQTNYESLAYTAVRSASGSVTSVTLMEENQTGIGAAASITADQLFVVKHYGGAFLVRGSLSNPTVVRLPFVESTGGVHCRPVTCPLGVVYGSTIGVHAYQGGDTSQHLSPQLAGDFWRIKNDPTNEKYLGIESRFEWWAPYVCVGNNWILDSRTNAWWRLDDPAAHNNRPFNAYSASPSSGKLYAFHYKLDGANRAVWQTFSRDTLAASWSWQSQPLIETQSDMHEFQEVELVAMRPANASGTCTVTVTLTGIGHDGATLASRTVTFDLAACTADRPAVLRKLIGGDGAFTARYVQVRIEAASSTGHAPKVFPGVGLWARRARSMPKV